jgi:CDP-glucose 4,6-dehydratase
MLDARPEVVIHMAAQPLVRLSYQNPVETYATNVMGTVHLLEAVRQTPGVKAVVNVTTDKCYENREWAWGYRENEPMGGYDPYSNSKGCAELVSAAYRSSFFNALGTCKAWRRGGHGARAGNVIGGGDWAQDRLIPDILRAFEAGNQAPIRNPHAIRPWQHVLEPLRGYLALAERLYEHGPTCRRLELRPQRRRRQTVAWIVEQWPKSGVRTLHWQLMLASTPHEAVYLKLDISQSTQRLNWHPA